MPSTIHRSLERNQKYFCNKQICVNKISMTDIYIIKYNLQLKNYVKYIYGVAKVNYYIIFK